MLKRPQRSSCNNLSAPPTRAAECHCYFMGSDHMTAAMLWNPVGTRGSTLQRVGSK